MIKYFTFDTMIWVLTLSLVLAGVASVISTGNFNKDFPQIWYPSHVYTSTDGSVRSLKLDQESGSGCWTKEQVLFGQIDMPIKLVPGYSAGTVVTFYLISSQTNRDEIDLEFLGNVTGQPYVLQTNVYTDGHADREERVYLWFDPTKDFHNYSVLWNIHQIVFMVDSRPIRTYRNHADKGVAFPINQPMSLHLTLWNGDSWATRGGRDKIDWSKGPFMASFRNYKIDACVWRGNTGSCIQGSSTNWWNQNTFSSLTLKQRSSFNWVRKNYLIYDYCQDNQRFQNNLPKECNLPKY